MIKSEMQHQYWVTKKAVQRKLGGKEDEHIVSSDAELDAKIELFKSISDSCLQLHRVIDHFQERLCILAQEENSLGKFLKDGGKNSATTGKVMTNAGKAISYCGQQRMLIRAPLVRLHHEVETFRGRAIADTKETMSIMERERTEYRAALSWMKSASSQLDPDSGKGLEKFRKAQNHVRSSKSKFDRMTLDCLQKIDLLAAARCNMFSHALVAYQQALSQFFTKTTETFKAASKSLALEPHYNFSILKELTQADKHAEVDDHVDGILDLSTNNPQLDSDQMLFFQDDFKDETANDKKSSGQKQIKDATETKEFNLIDIPIVNQDTVISNETENLLNSVTGLELKPTGLSESTDLLGLNTDFGDFMSAETSALMPSQLLLSDFNAFEMKSDNTADEEITVEDIDAEKNLFPMENKTKNSILDLFSKIPKTGSKTTSNIIENPKSSKEIKTPKPNKDRLNRKDMSAWFHLFAELDPLANPDAIDNKLDANSANNSHAA